MSEVLQSVAQYVQFGKTEQAAVRRLAPILKPHLPDVVAQFYARIDAHPETRAIFINDAQAARLRAHFAKWLETLLEGPYDAAYALQRARIGDAHVRVGLPQHYMFAALQVVWEALSRHVLASSLPDRDQALISLQRLFTIEVSLMLEAYKNRYTERITELERATLREQLSRVEHLAEIGQLAASLAHEIKNPLAGISGAIQVIQAGLPADDERREILEEVLRQVRRVDGTVRDLLAYARPRELDIRRCDLREVISHCLSLLRREPTCARVQLNTDELDYPDELRADQNQLEQLLVNLLLNAAQATRDGGTVSLRSALSETHCTLEVQDEGPGFTEDTLARACEPFFTTKARGTGLGLAIVRRIVETHNGTLELTNAPAGGGLVRVQLPLTSRQS